MQENTQELAHIVPIQSYSATLQFAQSEPRKRRRKQNQRDRSFDGPRVSFQDIHKMWFVYENKAYAVQTVSVSVLRDATLAYCHMDITRELFKKSVLDIIARWCIVCEAKEVKLYRSKLEAEGSLNASP